VQMRETQDYWVLKLPQPRQRSPQPDGQTLGQAGSSRERRERTAPHADAQALGQAGSRARSAVNTRLLGQHSVGLFLTRSPHSGGLLLTRSQPRTNSAHCDGLARFTPPTHQHSHSHEHQLTDAVTAINPRTAELR